LNRNPGALMIMALPSNALVDEVTYLIVAYVERRRRP
jgi:hypothetical protein